jgi:cytochrome c-type biogenesis protein CcmE
MAHRGFVLFGLGGVIALVIAITVTGISNNLTYYLYPTEAVDQKADFPDGERFRLAGLVVEGSLTEADNALRFDVTDGGATVAVVLTNTPPPLFDEEVPVLVEGAWDNGTFRADTAIIRHDENYELPEEGNYQAPDS